MPDTSGPGNLLFQGLNNLGSGVAQGFQNYTLMQQQDAAAQGQVNALLAQAQQTPGVYQSLSPDGQNLLQKQLAGNANRQDRIKLLGEVQTAQILAKNRMGQQLEQQQVQQGQMQNQMMQNRMNYMQNLMGPPQQGGSPQAQPPAAQPQGQPQQGAPAQGSPPPAGMAQFLNQPKPANYIQPPQALTIQSPQAQAMMQQALRMTMGDPEKASDLVQKQLDSVNKTTQEQYAQSVATEKDTGRLVYAGPQYEGGLPTMNLFNNEVVKGQGTPQESYTRGTKVIPFKIGVKPPSSVVFQPGQGMVNQQAAQAATSDPQADLASLAPVVTNNADFQKSIVAAKGQAAQDAGQLGEAMLLYKAAQAYTSGDQGQWNAIKGNPTYAKFSSLWTGTNPQAAFQTVLSGNIHSVLSQMQNAAGGTIGGRMLGTEFNKTVDMLGNPEADNPTILAAAKNNLILNQRKYDLSNAYAEYHRSMAPGDAETAAVKQFGNAPSLMDPGVIDTVPKAAIDFLKANRQNAAVLHQFEEKYGTGAAELGLVR